MQAHQHAQAVAGDLVQLAAVDDDRVQAGVDQLSDRLDERIRRLRVEVAVGLDDQDVFLDVVVAEFHLVTP